MLTIERIETIPIRVPLPFTYSGSYDRMRNRCTIVTRVYTAEGIVGEAYNADEDEPMQGEIERAGLGWVLDRAFIERYRVDRSNGRAWTRRSAVLRLLQPIPEHSPEGSRG